MNSAQLKIASWSVAGLLGAGFGLYVFAFFAQRQARDVGVSKEQMQSLLGNVKDVQQRTENIVALNDVYAAMTKYDWTGRKKVEAVVDTKPQEPEKPTQLAVRGLLKVLLVKTDTTDDEGSRCAIKYMPAAQVKLKDPVFIKHVGDRLDPPNQHVKVVAITTKGVEFGFDDESRAHETLLPEEMSLTGRVASSAPGTTPIVQPGAAFPRSMSYGAPPRKTQIVAPNTFLVGQEDADYWEANWDAELAQMQYDSHRDPKTGAYDGIEIRQVPAGSMAANHGAQAGDIIKSINGHPVKSVNEAINFAKNNANLYDVWEIEVENKGQIRIVTYKVPKKK